MAGPGPNEGRRDGETGDVVPVVFLDRAAQSGRPEGLRSDEETVRVRH